MNFYMKFKHQKILFILTCFLPLFGWAMLKVQLDCKSKGMQGL